MFPPMSRLAENDHSRVTVAGSTVSLLNGDARSTGEPTIGSSILAPTPTNRSSPRGWRRIGVADTNAEPSHTLLIRKSTASHRRAVRAPNARRRRRPVSTPANAHRMTEVGLLPPLHASSLLAHDLALRLRGRASTPQLCSRRPLPPSPALRPIEPAPTDFHL